MVPMQSLPCAAASLAVASRTPGSVHQPMCNFNPKKLTCTLTRLRIGRKLAREHAAKKEIDGDSRAANSVPPGPD